MVSVLVTCKQMQEYVRGRSFSGFNFFCPPLSGQSFTSAEMVALSSGFGVLIAGDDQLDESFFAATKGLKLVIRWGVGTDSVDFSAAAKHEVQVRNTPGVFNRDVAELALCYVLMLHRHVLKIHLGVMKGEWPKTSGHSLFGKRLGIFGFGGIGGQLSDFGMALGMSIHACDPFVNVEPPGVTFHKDFLSLAENSDALVLTAPLNNSTFHIVNSEFFQQLRDPIVLVNVSRGALVSEKSIPQAFDDGKLMGFATDVFEEEPLPLASPLRSLSGVILGAHNASNTQQGVERASERCLKILEDFSL